jgi:hypothetical protein
MIGHPNLKFFAKFDNNCSDIVGSSLQDTYPKNISYEDAIVGKGLVCGGLQDIRWVADDSKFKINYDTPITISFWLKTLSSPTGIYNELFSFNTGGEINSLVFNTIYNSGSSRWVIDVFIIANNDTLIRRYYGYSMPNYLLDFNGTTKHICITKATNTTASGLKLYIDGILFSGPITEVVSGGTTAAGNGWYPKIGTISYDASTSHTIDELSFFKNYEAAPTDVKRLSLGLHPLTRS